MLLALPVMADVDDSTNVQVNCPGYRYLDITGDDLVLTLTDYSDFGSGLALGNIVYTLYSNTEWKIMGAIAPQTGETWGLGTYVRGVTMDGQVAIDTDTGTYEYGVGKTWAATVDVPWNTAPATYKGVLTFTIGTTL